MKGYSSRVQRRAEGTAESTVEALICDVRSNGLKALMTSRERVRALSDAQILEVAQRLAKPCPACIGGVPKSTVDRILHVAVEREGKDA